MSRTFSSPNNLNANPNLDPNTHVKLDKQKTMKPKPKIVRQWAATLLIAFIATAAQAADKPNILFIVSDDTGYGDLGPWGGGVGRGMPTPNIDKMAKQGMM